MSVKFSIALRAIVFALSLAAPALAVAGDDLQSFLEQTLSAARDKQHLPGVAGLIQVDGKIVEAAVGVRAEGHPQQVKTSDRWHLGSNTKAFTATLIGRLVDQGKLRFEDTLAASFPALAAEMDPGYRDVTIVQVLTHTAGIPPLTDDKDLPTFLDAIKGGGDLKAQRAAVARVYLTKPPASKIGEFAYSNLGFIIAGAIAETRTGKVWEDLVREEIFTLLGIKNAGFGPPGKSGAFDQPCGHTKGPDGKLVALDPGSPDADNPLALGPAGTISIGLRDWLKFAQDQLAGVHGHGRLLKTETYRRLHTPLQKNYAMGWGVKLGADGTPELLTHSRSNGYWLADIRIMPKHDIIYLVVTNAETEGAEQAVKDIRAALNDRLHPFE